LARQNEPQHTGAEGAPAREPFTYVHRGTVVIGEIVATGRVRVHGEIRGSVKVDGVLEVAESGVIEGMTVEAHVVKVLGRVSADVVAGGKVEIWKGGVLTGNVTAPALDIEEGATFNGFSNMRPEGDVPEQLADADVSGSEDARAPDATTA
jgi:cytoskeletal protein CcmA (bactofilin family)